MKKYIFLLFLCVGFQQTAYSQVNIMNVQTANNKLERIWTDKIEEFSFLEPSANEANNSSFRILNVKMKDGFEKNISVPVYTYINFETLPYADSDQLFISLERSSGYPAQPIILMTRSENSIFSITIPLYDINYGYGVGLETKINFYDYEGNSFGPIQDNETALNGQLSDNSNTISYTNQIGVEAITVNVNMSDHTYSITPQYNQELADITSTQREALTAIYESLDGDNWTNNENWCSDKDIANWYGVDIDENGYVTYLGLSDNNLNGTVPDEIGLLSNLSILLLSNNSIHNLSSEIKKLQKLSFLSTSIWTDAIYECTNLSSLQFYPLHSVQIPLNIFKLNNLIFLDIINVYGIIPEEIGLLENLTDCRIYGPNLSGSIPSSIGNCTKLSSLDLSQNNLTGCIPAELGSLKELRNLTLCHNNLTGEIPESLSNLQKLESFQADNNMLTGNIPPKLGDIPTLQTLVLQNNLLSGDIPRNIQDNKNLWDYCWALIMTGNKFNLSSADIQLPDFEVEDVYGRKIKASEIYESHKYTVMLQFSHYFNDYDKFLTLKELYDTYHNKGLEIIGYNCVDENLTGVPNWDVEFREYVEEQGITWPVFGLTQTNFILPIYEHNWGTTSYDNYYPSNYFPYIFLVDEKGKVVFYSTDSSYKELKIFLTENLGEGLPDDIYASTDYSADGQVNVLQQATTGNGIDIVLMGDAFSDRLIADGTYERTMQTAMETFFDQEPYRTYRDMFNVYSVNVVSKNEIYNDVSDTALGSYFGGGTTVGGNDGTVLKYAQLAIPAERVDEALVIVMMNSDAYAGTCYMYYPTEGDYGNGASVAYFPLGTDDTMFAGLLHHEANGHGFAKLGDEYYYEHLGKMPANEMQETIRMQGFGWYPNISFSDDPTSVNWADFIEDPRYASEQIGIYEGGMTYPIGVYRPTATSIMVYNEGDFNAPSRAAIYNRIHKLAFGDSWQFNYEKFIEYDAVNRTAEAVANRKKATAAKEKLPPLTPPVVIKHSWREITPAAAYQRNINKPNKAQPMQ